MNPHQPAVPSPSDSLFGWKEYLTIFIVSMVGMVMFNNAWDDVFPDLPHYCIDHSERFAEVAKVQAQQLITITDIITIESEIRQTCTHVSSWRSILALIIIPILGLGIFTLPLTIPLASKYLLWRQLNKP